MANSYNFDEKARRLAVYKKVLWGRVVDKIGAGLYEVGMTRLSILVGIGLMLVGSMAYALPAVQLFPALFPTFAGIVIATGGFVAMNHDTMRKHLMHMNAVAAVMILVWASLKTVPDAMGAKVDSIPLISDLDTIGLSAILLYFAIKSFISARMLAQQEEDSLKNLDDKAVR